MENLNKFNTKSGYNIETLTLSEKNDRFQQIFNLTSEIVYEKIAAIYNGAHTAEFARAEVNSYIEDTFGQSNQLLNLLYDENQELLARSMKTEEQNDELVLRAARLNEELDYFKKAREAKEERRLKNLNKKPWEVTSPIFRPEYERLMQIIGKKITFAAARARFAITMMVITGLRIGELHNMQFKDIKAIFHDAKAHLNVNRLKNGPQQKAYLTLAGKQLIAERKLDYTILFETLDEKEESYMFSSEREKQKIRREYLNKSINEPLRILSEENHVSYTSHSFRKGYITDLWQKTGDIYLVKSIIGHSKVETTAGYIENPSPKEISDRMQEL